MALAAGLVLGIWLAMTTELIWEHAHGRPCWECRAKARRQQRRARRGSEIEPS
jgi:hypothetical protein